MPVVIPLGMKVTNAYSAQALAPDLTGGLHAVAIRLVLVIRPCGGRLTGTPGIGVLGPGRADRAGLTSDRLKVG